jgi:hypothetical protein
VIQTLPLPVDSVLAQERVSRRASMWGYLAVVGTGLVIGLAGFGLTPQFTVAFALLVCVSAVILVRPIAGVYLTVFFSVLGDGVTMVGYPFNANFSSHESMLYIANRLTFSPVELCIFLTAVGWFVRVASARHWRLFGRPLLWPVVAFGAFAVGGFVYGVFLKGGDLTVAMWEIRPLLYLVAMYVLTSNLLTRTQHYLWLAWAVVLAITVQNLFSLHFYYSLSSAQREGLEALTEHPTSLFYGWLFLVALGVWVLRGGTRWAKFLLLLAVIPSAWVFVLSERRAAVVALAGGFAIFATMLFFRRRKAFWVLVPIVVLLTATYTAAFWNSTGGVGFGARAVKTVFSSKDVSERDTSSDDYRQIENFDLVNTIRVTRLTGIGFGKPFYQPSPLPDISFFVFYQYIPHNSVLWIWLKMGYLGFVTMLVIIAASIRAGIRASFTVPTGDALAVTIGALAFIVMFFLFAYVDLIWGPKTCLFLAVCMATCVNMPKLAAREAEAARADDLPVRLDSR